MKLRHTAVSAFLTSLMLLICASCVTDPDESADSLQAGDMLPEFSVRRADGSTVSRESLAGRPSVICFFNTGCEDCRRELPELQRAFEMSSELENCPRFVCIARDEKEADIARFWADNGLTLPYSPQEGRAVYELFAKSVIPRIYISSPSLRIIASYGDSSMPTAEEIINHLK